MANRTLFHSAAVSVFDYRCDGYDSRGDERADGFQLVFVRSGVFRIESARGTAIVDPARALLLESDERFRIRHPGPCDDHCLVVRVAAETFDQVREASGRAARTPKLVADCRPALYVAQRRLSARLERHEDALAVAEQALALVEAVHPAAPGSAAAGAHPRDADERVAAVRALLAHRYGERLSLADVGRCVGLSPFRIARLFRAATGSTIHGHRIDLRLRAAVERLGGGEKDLTGLALDLGFADHAHFTNAFRRRYGVSPSRFRAAASA